MSNSNPASILKAADLAAQSRGTERSVVESVQPCQPVRRFAVEAWVVGEDDEPLADIAVELLKTDSEVLRAKTGTDGIARFEQIESGSYKLSLYELDMDAWALLDSAALKWPASTGDATWHAPAYAAEAAILHQVQEGECIAKLADRYGFASDTVWTHPANANLKALRKTKYILYAGDSATAADQVTIPPKRRTHIVVATGMGYRVRRIGIPEVLRLQFLVNDKPRKQIACLVSLSTENGQVIADRALRTDDQGKIAMPIPPRACHARVTLMLGTEEMEYNFLVGHLEPFDTNIGVQARLHNLGFSCGDEAGELGPATKQALYAFQDHYQLPLSGDIDEATLKKLKEYYTL